MSRDFFKSNNPLIKEETLKGNAANQPLDSELVYSGELMTVNGAVNKTFILFAVMLAASTIGYMFPSKFMIFGGAIGGAVISFITAKNPSKSPIFAPIYAICQGLFVGAISAIYSYMFEGIIFQAATLTFGILFTMLFLYKAKIIKVTEKYRSMVMMAVGGIMIVYAIEWILYMFGIDVPFLHDQSAIGIGISLVIVGVASLKLAVDFDDFEKGERMRTPDYMEWYFGMGLLFTLVWLYSEILYLLSAFSGD